MRSMVEGRRPKGFACVRVPGRQLDRASLQQCVPPHRPSTTLRAVPLPVPGRVLVGYFVVAA